MANSAAMVYLGPENGTLDQVLLWLTWSVDLFLAIVDSFDGI